MSPLLQLYVSFKLVFFALLVHLAAQRSQLTPSLHWLIVWHSSGDLEPSGKYAQDFLADAKGKNSAENRLCGTGSRAGKQNKASGYQQHIELRCLNI